jgi:hypothetical protein
VDTFPTLRPFTRNHWIAYRFRQRAPPSRFLGVLLLAMETFCQGLQRGQFNCGQRTGVCSDAPPDPLLPTGAMPGKAGTFSPCPTSARQPTDLGLAVDRKWLNRSSAVCCIRQLRHCSSCAPGCLSENCSTSVSCYETV